MASNTRDLALFNMAVDSKLRGFDLVALQVRDVFAAGRVKERTSMIQSKTGKPVRFEITETTRLSLERWIGDPEMIGLKFLWPSRIHSSPHLSTRQYARIVRGWVMSLGAGAERLRHAFHATDQGRADLQEDREPARGPAAAGAHEDG
jgi:integrase